MNKNIVWKHLLSRRWTILRCELFTKGYVDPLEKYIGVPNRDLLVTKESEKFSLYNSIGSLKEISLALLAKLKKDKNFGEKIYKDCINSCVNLVKVSKMASDGNLENTSSNDLIKRLREYYEAALEFTPFLALPNNYEMFVTDEKERVVNCYIGSRFRRFLFESNINTIKSKCESETNRIFSLRDKNNNPHVTIQVNRDKIAQIKGKQNEPPILKYSDYIIKWILKHPEFKLQTLDELPVSKKGLLLLQDRLSPDETLIKAVKSRPMHLKHVLKI